MKNLISYIAVSLFSVLLFGSGVFVGARYLGKTEYNYEIQVKKPKTKGKSQMILENILGEDQEEDEDQGLQDNKKGKKWRRKSDQEQ